MQHIIFDLDGTISNPETGILNGYKYTFPRVNLPTPADEELRQLIGPPLRRVFEDIYRLSPSDADIAIQTYRYYYNELGGAYENVLYGGIRELIESLTSNQRILHVATHKSAMAEKILQHFSIYHHFSQIQYYNEEKNITTKERMIELILEAENYPDNQQVVMIGDRHSDIEAAKNCGILSIGVTYGFGSKDEITRSAPDFIAENPGDLHAVLQQFFLSSPAR